MLNREFIQFCAVVADDSLFNWMLDDAFHTS